MKKLILGLMIATMSTQFVGCASEETTQKSEATENIKETETQKETETSKEEVPQEEVEVEHRIVASSVAVVEILDRLGVSVVGVPTTQYELPESAKSATEIGSPMSPDMEIIKSLDPTVVISVSTLSPDLAADFEKLGIPVQFADLSSYEGVKTTITELAALFGKEAEAETLIADFELREETIATTIEGKEEKEVLVMFGAPGSFMVGTETSYVGDLVKQVGGKNVIEGQESSFIPVDMEYLVSKNPDVILALTHADPEASKKMFEDEFATNPLWENFDAVKEDKIFYLPNGYFGMSGNLQAIDAMEILVDMLYE